MAKQSRKYSTILLSHQKTGIKAKLLSKISMCCFIARIQLTVFLTNMKTIGLDVLISITSLRSARAYFSQHAMQLVIRAQSRNRTKQLAMDVYQENYLTASCSIKFHDKNKENEKSVLSSSSQTKQKLIRDAFSVGRNEVPISKKNVCCELCSDEVLLFFSQNQNIYIFCKSLVIN